MCIFPTFCDFLCKADSMAQVLAYGPTNGLYHACLAVQDARWGMENFDDWSAAEELLAAANRTLRMLLGNSRVEDIQETTEEDGEGV